MNFSYIIIDDDQDSVLKTKAIANGFSELVFLASANNYSVGLDLILEFNPKLVFLEIDPANKASNLSLALINELYRYLKEIPKIIITTRSNELAYNAIQYEVTDFLIKPVKRIDFIKLILKINKEELKELSPFSLNRPIIHEPQSVQVETAAARMQNGSVGIENDTITEIPNVNVQEQREKEVAIYEQIAATNGTVNVEEIKTVQEASNLVHLNPFEHTSVLVKTLDVVDEARTEQITMYDVKTSSEEVSIEPVPDHVVINETIVQAEEFPADAATQLDDSVFNETTVQAEEFPADAATQLDESVINDTIVQVEEFFEDTATQLDKSVLNETTVQVAEFSEDAVTQGDETIELNKSEIFVKNILLQETAIPEVVVQQLSPVVIKPLVLCIKSYGDYRYIDASDICYFQADNNSTDIHLNNGEMITAFKTLKHFEGILPYPFSRIHNSYIVNRDYISRIHTGNAVCYIKNSTTKLPFSKSYKENVDVIISDFANGNYLEI